MEIPLSKKEVLSRCCDKNTSLEKFLEILDSPHIYDKNDGILRAIVFMGQSGNQRAYLTKLERSKLWGVLKKVDVTFCDASLNSVLHHMAYVGYIDVLYHPKVNELKNKYGKTPLDSLWELNLVPFSFLKQKYPWISESVLETDMRLSEYIESFSNGEKFILT